MIESYNRDFELDIANLVQKLVNNEPYEDLLNKIVYDAGKEAEANLTYILKMTES